MGHPTAREFRESHKNISDTNSGYNMDAAEKVAEDLNRVTKDMTPAQKQQYFKELAEDSAKHPGDYANFKMEDGHLHVVTRGFSLPINLGMSKDTDLQDKMKQVAGKHQGGTAYETDRFAHPDEKDY
jgi:hypothetical protein